MLISQTSTYFLEQLGRKYQLEINWTSDKRKAAGHKEYLPSDNSGTQSGFTFSGDQQQAIAKLLAKCGAARTTFSGKATSYHFEVVATVDDIKSPFPWTLLQLDKISRSCRTFSEVQLFVCYI